MIAAMVSTIILIFAGLNWALVGIFDWNMVTAIFGYSLFTRIFYAVLGLAALYMIFYTVMQTLKHSNEKGSSKNKKSTNEV